MSEARPADTADTGVDDACAAASAAAPALRDADRPWRAGLLEAVAVALEAAHADIVATADGETLLGAARINNELTRTVYQWRVFADAVREGGYLEATIDHAGDTPMGPRPDLRRVLVPIGVVAVFGASNFPLAFSVPGGDVAAALAVGCPVVAKGHEAHPLTSALCARLMREACEQHGAPAGTIGLVLGRAAGSRLVTAPSIRAVAFTGSERGGRALMDLINTRAEPVPFYGELGSLNPLVVTPAAANERAEEIGRGLAASFTLGLGQFCTKPGVVLVPRGSGGDAVVAAAAAAIVDAAPAAMLTPAIADAFGTTAAAVAALPAVHVRIEGRVGASPRERSPWLFEVDAEALDEQMLVECFGPATLVARYTDHAQLPDLVARMPSALTATIHRGRDEQLSPRLIDSLVSLAGRIVFDGYPTGVAVAWAQHHGGGWPATNSIHTSVGVSAMRRFLTPRAWQDAPQEVLPVELRDGLATVPRRVDGTLELPPSNVEVTSGR